MATMLAGAITTLGVKAGLIGVGSAAATKASIATGIATAAKGAALVGTIGLGAFSAYQSIKAGKTAQQQAELQAQAERTQFAVEDAERQKRLRAALGSQLALFGGGGIDVSSGTPLTIAKDSYDNAQTQTRQASAFSSAQQSQLRLQGKQSLISSRAQAAGSILGAATNSFQIARSFG